MIDLIKGLKKAWFILGPLYVFLIVVSVVPVPYDITTPGGLNKVESVIQIEESNPQTGSIHTVYVYALDGITLLQYWLGLLDSDFTLTKSNPDYDLTMREQKISGTIMKDVSRVNSVIRAYTMAGKPITYAYNGVIVYVTYRSTDPGIKLGDILTHVNGVKIESRNDFFDKVNSHACDERFNITIIRDGIEIPSVQVARNTHEDGCYLGISTYDHHLILSASPQFHFLETPTTGPSGGLMQTIAVYNAITESDITRGLKIAGTGTIDIAGNVGEIGGTYQKVLAAHRQKADSFFYPAGSTTNTKDANAAYATLRNPKMVLIGVHTFDEAILALQEWEGTDE